MPQANDAPTAAARAATGDPHDIAAEPEVFMERRCWRCLKMFPGDAPAGPSPTADFWLCDPCDAALIPQRAARH
jgi:hypothetical protein